MRRSRTALDLVAVFFAIASLLAEWTISIPPAHLPETFGYQAPAFWLAAAGLTAALILEARYAVWALVFTEAVLAVWFAWAMWVVTTPRFTSLPFPFMATDVLGSGFYAAGAALLAAGAAVVWDLRRREPHTDSDLWLLTALPGVGLMRLGRWLAGTLWMALVAGTFYLASTDSPDAALFEEFGRFGQVPPAYPRAVEWVLLGTAAVLFAMSVGATVWQRRVANAGKSALN